MDWLLYGIGLHHERVNMDEVLSVDLSSTVFVFGDFNMLHVDWVTYSSGTDRPGKLCYNFSISNDLNQKVNFPTGIPGSDSHNPALLDLFLTLVFVLQWLSLQKFMTVSTNFSSNLKKDVSFCHLWLFLGWSSWSCWERFHGKSSASKVKCRQASNRCKRILKTRVSLPRNFARSSDFWWIGNSVLKKDKSAIPPIFNRPEVLSSPSYKTKLFVVYSFAETK